MTTDYINFCGYIGPCAHKMSVSVEEINTNQSSSTPDTNQVSNTPTNDEDNLSPTFSMEKIQEDIHRRIKSNDLEGIYNLIDNAETQHFSDDKSYGKNHGKNIIMYNNNFNIQYAAYLGNIEIVDYFLAKTLGVVPTCAGENPLNRAFCGIAESGNINTLNYYMFSRKIDVTQFDNLLFNVACQYGKMEMIKYMCETLKIVDINNKNNLTHEMPKEVFDYFISRGVSYKDYELGRIACSAASNGDLEFVKYLVSLGASIPSLSNGARWSAQNGHLEVLKYLRSLNVNINDGECQGLIWAAQYNRITVIKYLVENGADISSQDHKALRYAVNNNHMETVKYLMGIYTRDKAKYSDATFRDICIQVWTNRVSDGYYYGP